VWASSLLRAAPGICAVFQVSDEYDAKPHIL
jgi:hypothetical protein